MNYRQLKKAQRQHLAYACHGRFSYEAFRQLREYQRPFEKEWRNGNGIVPCWECLEIARMLGIEEGVE